MTTTVTEVNNNPSIVYMLLGWFVFSCLVTYLSELAEKQNSKVPKLLAMLGVVVFSCLILYLSLVWPQCIGSPSLSNRLVINCLSIGSVAALAYYWCSRVFSAANIFKTCKRYYIILFAAILATIRFSYTALVPYFCSG